MRDFVPVLSDCATIDQFAIALGVDRQLLELLASDQASIHYRLHKIPKRSKRRRGEFRAVYEPTTDELKSVHKTLARRLSLFATHADPSFPRACAFGYIRDRSIKDNAKQHCGARLLLKADIKDFFPTISPARVEALFRRLRIQRDLAALLSRIYCFTGSLTPGLSGSPLIANLACHDLDGRMLDLATRYSATYTRYADDISISGETLPRKTEISAELEAEGFTLSESKHRVIKRGQAQFVTGLSVSDEHRPHAPKSMKRQLRQELYYCKKFGIAEHLARTEERVGKGINRLDGTIKYVSFIEKGTSHDHRLAWDSLLTRDDQSPSYHPRHDIPTRQHFVAIDEAFITSRAGRFLALACVLYSNLQIIESAVSDSLSEYLADPFSAGRKAVIAKEGLHFSAAHPELKNKFVSRMPTLPFRCYIALRRCASDDGYRDSYLSLLRWSFWILCMRCDRQEVGILVEQNPRLTAQEIKSALAESYALLAKAGTKRPLTEPSVEIVSKKVASISVPDFMLGVLGKFVEPRTNTERLAEDSATSRLQFERLRDRYSLIFDLDRNSPYSRRRPFQADSLDVAST